MVKELIVDIKKGDKKSFQKLYHNYYYKILNFSYKHLQSKEESEEITQDVFMKIWKKRADLNEELSFDGLIFKIAKFAIIDRIRKKSKLPHTQEVGPENQPSYAPIEDELSFKELKLIYEEIIESLPEKRRQVYLMSRNEGLTHPQIAQQLNISIKTVENQMGAALKHIREKLSIKTDILIALAFFIFLV